VTEAAQSVVAVAQGRLRGNVAGGVHSFKGVPYAEPITGPAKWLPPQARRPWTGIRDAQGYRISCPQFSQRGDGRRLPFPRARARFIDLIQALETFEEGDDCLVLNVWTPTPDRSARLPVMVYFHGGGLQTGAAHGYECTRLAQQGIVAISAQYRLGPLGFLHGSGLFPGNLCADNRGFLDQLAVLQWVQENISAFGGDPGCVTIAGESGGAQSVFLLAASPRAKGLFRRAIAMGGNTYAWAPVAEYHQLARDALQDVGVAAGNVGALTSLGPQQVKRLWQRLVHRGSGKAKTYGAISAVKGNVFGAAIGTGFLAAPPLACYAAGTPSAVDLLLGTCRDEGSLFSIIFPPFLGLSARLAAGYLGAALAPGGDVKKLVSHYRAQMPDAGSRRVYEQLNTDLYFRAPTLAAAEAHAAGHPGRTFHYQVDRPSSIAELGAMHGTDVALVMGDGVLKQWLDADAETLELSRRMCEAWCTFVKTGKPAAKGLPEWRPFDSRERLTMVLDTTCRLESDLDGSLLRTYR
jgi:para-nitrobenzyl esterase